MSGGENGDDDDTGDFSTEEFDLDLVALEEGRRTVDKQNEILNNIDDKAARILRINLVIVGLILTGLSVATGAERQTDPVQEVLPDVINTYTELGLLALLLSTGVAALTYTASALRIGVTGGSLRKIVFEGDTADRKRLRGLTRSYSKWIEQNYRTNAYNAPLATLTLIFLVYAVVLFTLGGIETIRPVQWYENVVALVFIIIFTALTGIKGQIQRYLRLRGEH
jgi:uncharacterized membrane protein YozB (DUF420 family)